MAEPIRLGNPPNGNFPDLSVEDTVISDSLPGGSGADLELELETAPEVTWWKALEVQTPGGAPLMWVETQDADHGPNLIVVPASLLPFTKLVLAKAKVFGIHTGMYELYNLDAHSGRRLRFLWQRDQHRNGPFAGFLRDLGSGISQAANAVADFVENVVNAVAEFIADLIETIGTAIGRAVDWIGTLVGGIPIVGPILRGFLHWAATIVWAVFSFIATAVKALLNLGAGVVGGWIRMVGGGIGGLMAWDGRMFAKGFGDIATSILGNGLIVFGKAAAVGQAVLGFQIGERTLTRAELELLRQVYRNSVALYNVRMVEGFAGLANIGDPNRPFTLGNTIYWKQMNPATNLPTVVHEVGHVWQYQHQGARYLTDAIGAMIAVLPDPYSWQAELGRGNLRWQDFNKEAQAQFLQDVWASGTLIGGPTTPGVFYKDDPIGTDVRFLLGGNNTLLALASIAYVRSFWALRLSGLF
jgi:hypothetical protein